MSSVQKNNKIKKLLDTENKKPPKNVNIKNTENQQQNKKESTKKISKDIHIEKNEKIITNEPFEKEMLKGQEHKEEESKEEKNIIESNNNTNLNNNNIEEPNSISVSPKKEKEKESIAFKPRENYLKEKMLKMNYSAKLVSTINKSLDNQVKSVQNDILDNQVLITSTIPKHINKILYSSPEPLSSGEIPRMKDFNVKSRLKTIKDLKNEKEVIKNNLKRLLENEKLIKDETFGKLYSLKQSQTNLTLDKVLKIEKLKTMESKKNGYLQQINEIEFKINEIISNKNNELTSRRKKIKLFLDNFERDKEIAEIRAKKYYKESKQISQRMGKDIESILGKVKKELEEKEKEDKKKKLDLLENFKKKEKAIEQKRYKEYMKKASAFKNFIGEKPKLKNQDYLFNKNTEKFTQEEAKVIRLENDKRKAYMKSITKEELKEFANNFKENKEKQNNMKEEKKQKLFSEWKERRGLLPTYVSCFSQEANIETKKLEEEEIKKEERIHTLIKIKKDFSNQIKEEKQPRINKKLKLKRLDEINKLENPKLFMIKRTLSTRKKKRVILKKPDPTKPSKFSWKLKLEEDIFDNFNKSESVNNTLVRRPKKIHCSSSFENKEHKPLDKKIDYLREMTVKREKDRQKIMTENFSYPKNNGQKWDKIINNFNGNIIENVHNVKNQADYLEKEAHMQEKVLNLNGGIENNPELGMKISNLIIDSIEAKLSILNKITS